MDWMAIKQAAQRLSPNGGWRCLEELADDPEFRALLHREFQTPPEAAEFSEVSRRDFLKLLGGTLALAGVSGVSGCVRQPQETIVPYVNQPEHRVPGKAVFYATALEFCGYGRGVVVETHEGRPTKVEGNPLHPASLGATSVFEQAAILDLYNPGRSSAVLKAGEVSTWPTFLAELQGALAKLPRGEGLHVLTGTVTSPAFGAQWQGLLQRYPAAQWHQYEPVNQDAAFEGASRAFGQFLETQYHFDKARVVVSFGADFLFDRPGSVRYARDLMAGRNVRSGQASMNRLYVLESAPTLTGAFADDRRAVGGLGADGMAGYAAALAAKLGVTVSTPGWKPGAQAGEWAARVAADLQGGGGPSLLIAGAGESPELHALVHAMNAALGNFSEAGGSISHSAPVALAPMNQGASLKALASAIEAGSVQVLLMLGGNWARTAPADLGMDGLIRRVPLSIHLGLYRDETADAAKWHIPQAHPFESWSDIRAFDGTTSIIQPLIAPLFGGRSLHELLDCVAQYPGRNALEIIRAYWVQPGRLAGTGDEPWRRALHDGVVANSALPGQAVAIDPSRPVTVSAAAKPERALELVFAPDYGVWDGRFAENAWLQELPRPITRLSWENALLVSPATAQQRDLNTGDVICVRASDGREIRGAALVQPGVADEVFAVTLGCGSRVEPGPRWLHREKAARAFEGIGLNTGMDVYPIRTSGEAWRRGITIEKTGERHELVTTQKHHLMEGRDLVRIATLADLDKLSKEHPVPEEEPPTFYNLTRAESAGTAWAMVIDLTRCIGCNACVLACQSENNIPPVGRREVGRGRAMHWIRIDSYYFGDPAHPKIAFQPVPCMHCETAPCEQVCPVEATLHDHEGLNLQVYNRCIGTRYCSNNCPYKVRRFNFFRYAKAQTSEPLFLMQNPNVTVRSRGVMEKCTYCVQRISKARISSQLENRAIRDGEVTPACAQACPTETIVFGNKSDLTSRVAAFKKSPLNYSVLGEENTRPRTTYLTRVTNPV